MKGPLTAALMPSWDIWSTLVTETLSLSQSPFKHLIIHYSVEQLKPTLIRKKNLPTLIGALHIRLIIKITCIQTSSEKARSSCSSDKTHLPWLNLYHGKMLSVPFVPPYTHAGRSDPEVSWRSLLGWSCDRLSGPMAQAVIWSLLAAVPTEGSARGWDWKSGAKARTAELQKKFEP